MKKDIYGNDQVLYVKGLDPTRMYTLKEINKVPIKKSLVSALEGKTFSGDFLMTYGVRFVMHEEFESVVFQLVAK